MSRSPRFQEIYAAGPPFRNIALDWWDDLEQHPSAKLRLARGEQRIGVTLYNAAPTHELNLEALSWLHRLAFGDVFPELAGPFRDIALLPLDVEFGRFRGTHYGDVLVELTRFEQDMASVFRQLNELAGQGDPDELFEGVLQVAAFAHCEVIRIHPFINGNGRTARLCINFVTQQFSYQAIPITRPKGEYLDATRTWMDRRRIDHFVDFLRPLVRTPPEQAAP